MFIDSQNVFVSSVYFSPFTSCVLQSLMAHNEDNDPYFMDLGYFVHARVTGASGAAVEEFTHYCYPGILCGDAYGFNSNGVVMTQNALFPSDVNLETWAIREYGATSGRYLSMG